MSDPGQHSSSGSIEVIERLFADYITDPESVSVQWRNYFDSLPADPDALQSALERVATVRTGRLARPSAG